MLLSEHEIALGLQRLHGWRLNDEPLCIQKEWTFNSFRTAMNFFAAVGELAERVDHHPALFSNYKKMRIQLNTHDAHGLTAKDFQLAMQIDELLDTHFSGVWN
jgi:4a-hydroxytetrahydrobiopterin dehydratase